MGRGLVAPWDLSWRHLPQPEGPLLDGLDKGHTEEPRSLFVRNGVDVDPIQECTNNEMLSSLAREQSSCSHTGLKQWHPTSLLIGQFGVCRFE